MFRTVNIRPLVAILIFTAVYIHFEVLSSLSSSWESFYYFIAKSIVCTFFAALFLDIFNDRIFKGRIDATGKAVFITGCDSGFGYHLAKRLDSKGYKVFAGCLFPDKGGALELQETSSQRLKTLRVDVTSDDSVDRAKDFVVNNLEDCKLWAIVNNAGIFRGMDVEICSMEHYKACLEVNALGPVRVTKAFLPLIRRSKGRVVNVNSLAGRFSAPYLAAYCMSKYASVTFTECLKQEMARWGVTVISIEPEFFQTSLVHGDTIGLLRKEMLNDIDEEVKKDYGNKFLDHSKKVVENLFETSSPNFHYVVNAMESAISSEYPAPVYKPCRNLLVKFLLYLGEQSPKSYIFAINKFLM